MYSVIPALVSFLFLFYGLFVINQKGINRISMSFMALCITTFFWQFTWAALFQADNPETANQLIKIGWLLILLLPTSLYHFVTEITGNRSELKFVFLSYTGSLALAAVMIATDQVINGYYDYFWGYYPKAGPLLFLHIAQTTIVVVRGQYITFQKMRASRDEGRSRLALCLAGQLVYCLAAVDYLCNYGLEIYPPGVLFITVSLGIIAVATTRFHLMDSARAIAASVAHEMRTPMATVKMQAQALSNYMPDLIQGYQFAKEHRLTRVDIDQRTLDSIGQLAHKIEHEVERTSQAIDMLLAVTSNMDIEPSHYRPFSVSKCVNEALEKYPFEGNTRSLVRLIEEDDFEIQGSDTFFTFVLFNLIKNALYAIQEKGTGTIDITVRRNSLELSDTGMGIPASTLPYIFENFYSTKSRSSNAGVGLAFCKRVVEAFGGKILCKSKAGEGTTFILSF